MLATIWAVLWGLLWAVYFTLDGFVLGMGTLLPFIAKTDEEKRVVFNAAGPYWDANQVWLITAGGVTFAAFPKAYAVMFSALYAPLLLLLFALIFRAVSFEFRNKIQSEKWTGVWDKAQCLGNFIPALLIGIAFANLFMGIPIDEKGVYQGNILMLLNIYGLGGGLFFVVFFCLHGSLWLTLKSDGVVKERAISFASKFWLPLFVMSVIFLLITVLHTHLYRNYIDNPILLLIPVVAVVTLIGIRVMLGLSKFLYAWLCSALFIIAITFFGVVGMFPGIIISSIDPAYSVTILNGASSELTLKIMLGVVVVFLPIVLIYQAWAYHLFAHRVSPESIKEDTHAY